MAGVTSAVIGGIGALGSAASSISAAKAQKKAAKRAQKQAAQAAMRSFGFTGPDGSSGSFDPATGQLVTDLGDRLTGQRDSIDAFTNLFGNQVGADFGGQASSLLDLQGLSALQGPQANNNFFSALQGGIGNNLGLAQGGIGQALGFGQATNPLGNAAFGIAGQQLGDIGTFDQVRGSQLDLLRQQAAPFEQRAFDNLQNNQFATGRLGSSGGALQTEAFARGLGQADLDRQLAASSEARNVQNNALGLASGSFGLGSAQRSLADSLLGNAFNRFGDFAGLASDVEGNRFAQNLTAQNNNFNQLQGLFGNALGLEGFQQESQNNAFSQFLASMGAGNALNQIPMNNLQAAAQLEAQRGAQSGASANVQAGLVPQFGASGDATAAAFSGLSQAAQGGGLNFLSGLFGGNSTAPQMAGVTGAGAINPFVMNTVNPFAGIPGGSTLNPGGFNPFANQNFGV